MKKDSSLKKGPRKKRKGFQNTSAIGEKEKTKTRNEKKKKVAAPQAL